jgi:hypothetical protein
MAGAKIALSTTAGELQQDDQGNALCNTPGFDAVGVAQGGGYLNAGSMAIFSENDTGELWGERDMLSAEVDDDYRQRQAMDNLLDIENYNYTSGQNTGKYRYDFITMTTTVSASGMLSNAASSVATTVGVADNSWAEFPFYQNQTLIYERTMSFSSQPVANTFVDFGMGRRATANPFAPTDGAYFRLTSAGLFGVVNNAGSELAVQCLMDAGASNWTYTNNALHRFLIQVSNVRATFWVNNEKVADIPTPVGQNAPFRSSSLPTFFRHAIAGGAAGGVFQTLTTDQKVLVRGQDFNENIGATMQRALGSYQGLSGGTMGQLVAGTVTSGTLVKPTAAVPLNTSLAANLPNSLAGRIYETLTAGLAANVDGIFAQYQVPAGTVSVQGRRLKVTGIKLSGFVSTVVAGGTAVQTEWYIAFGNTAASLATAESASFANATTKAPRRVLLPELTTTMQLTQAAGTLLVQPAYASMFPEPIYVNPGEFISLVGNKTGTVATSGVLSYMYQFVYAWE